MSPTDKQRAAALRGVLLGRLARLRPEGLIPDEAFVQMASQYMRSYRRSRVSASIGNMALTLGWAYRQLDNHGIERAAKVLTRAQRADRQPDADTSDLSWRLAGHIRDVAARSL
jgi:hypothetical protein